ncbi:MAG: type II toxin-antitoxin system HicA family toxin [Chloroflexi bacterium]|nr:type II toxin-antitoxin system HicA family toxin [Chloroflexota bacterium]
MSEKLPQVSGDEVVRALRRAGYEQVRQKGSHIRLRDPENPLHRRVIPGLLRKMIRDANLTIGEFNQLLR